MWSVSRRAVLLGGTAALAYGAGRLAQPAVPSMTGAALLDPGTPEGMLNDASGLSATPVHKHLILQEDPGEALIASIRAEIAEARAAGRPVAVGAARHSMGGQALPREGTALSFDHARVEIDGAANTYLCGAGTRWSQVIAALDPAGLSPKVMQSNNDFGVAATFSVGAHGWPVPYGPMGSTVQSLRVVLPSGDLALCSRTENPDLFAMAMGGYGLAGVIVDMVVEAVPNARLEPRFDEFVPAEGFASALQAAVQDPAVLMAYGRLNVDRARFLKRALLVTYRATEDQSELPTAEGSGVMAHLASRIYRAQLGREPMRRFRWWNETSLGPRLSTGPVTRNSLINEPVATLADRDPGRTDILHEYFVGIDQFDAFLTACREVIPASYQEFLNVTLRYVAPDETSWLSYAPVPRIAAVMSFSQELTQRAEDDMTRMTRALIDRILEIGGSYYLPYRPHARLDQFQAAYPRAAEFAQAKRARDPDLVLRNNLWDSYLGRL